MSFDTKPKENDLLIIVDDDSDEQEETKKIEQIQKDVEGLMGGFPMYPRSFKEQREADSRSIYVGNVDYGATAEELQILFRDCGTVNRVTIPCNKLNGSPKGYAYIEFHQKSSVAAALRLDGAVFRQRIIKVTSKRTNVPGVSNCAKCFSGCKISQNNLKLERKSRFRIANKQSSIVFPRTKLNVLYELCEDEIQ